MKLLIPIIFLLFFLCGCETGEDVGVWGKEEFFQNISATRFDYYPLPIYESYDPAPIVWIGFSGYKLDEKNKLSIDEIAGASIVSAKNQPELYAQLYKGVTEGLKKLNEPGKTGKILNFISKNKDTLIFVYKEKVGYSRGTWASADGHGESICFSFFGLLLSQENSKIFYVLTLSNREDLPPETL